MRTVARSEGGARSPSLWRRSLTKQAAPDAKRETFLLPVELHSVFRRQQIAAGSILSGDLGITNFFVVMKLH